MRWLVRHMWTPFSCSRALFGNTQMAIALESRNVWSWVKRSLPARFSFRCAVQGADVPMPHGFLLTGFLLTLKAFALSIQWWLQWSFSCSGASLCQVTVHWSSVAPEGCSLLDACCRIFLCQYLCLSHRRLCHKEEHPNPQQKRPFAAFSLARLVTAGSEGHQGRAWGGRKWGHFL